MKKKQQLYIFIEERKSQISFKDLYYNWNWFLRVITVLLMAYSFSITDSMIEILVDAGIMLCLYYFTLHIIKSLVYWNNRVYIKKEYRSLVDKEVSSLARANIILEKAYIGSKNVMQNSRFVEKMIRKNPQRFSTAKDVKEYVIHLKLDYKNNLQKNETKILRYEKDLKELKQIINK